MQRAVVRAVALAAGLILVVEGCSSAASPVASQPALAASQAAASQAPSMAASPSPAVTAVSPVPAGSPLPAASPAATATPAPSVAPSPPAAGAGGIAGSWNGTWQDKTVDQASGTFVVTLAQKGTALTGSIIVKGTPCLTSGTVTGAVNGSTINFGAVSGRVQITYSGSVIGTTMKGTYAASAMCGDAKGDWQATKK